MAEAPDFARALGKLPSGLFIVTAGHGAGASGMLASFVQQAGFQPAALTLALRKGRPLVDLVRREGRFGLSQLGEGAADLFARFARGGDDVHSVADLRTVPGSTGVPLIAGACAHLECEVIGESEWTDHVIFCGRVTAGACVSDERPWVHLRRNGLSY